MYSQPQVVQFIPATAGWIVQQVYVENGPVALDFPLAGWMVKTDGSVVPVYWDQANVSNPSLREAIPVESEGVFHHVTGPGEKLLATDELQRELDELESYWISDRLLWRKLGVSLADGRAIHYEGLPRYEQYLAIPTWERRAGGFAGWAERNPAEESAF